MGSIYLYVSISFFALDLGLFKGDEKYGLVNACCSPAANTRNTWFDLVVDLFPFDLRMVNFDTLFLVLKSAFWSPADIPDIGLMNAADWYRHTTILCFELTLKRHQ